MSAPGSLEAGTPGNLYDALQAWRDELREQSEVEWSAGDVADRLDVLLAADDPLVLEVDDLLHRLPDPDDRSVAVAVVELARTRLSEELVPQVIEEVADHVAATPIRCPVHDSTEGCCDLPAAVSSAVAGLIRALAEPDGDDATVRRMPG